MPTTPAAERAPAVMPQGQLQIEYVDPETLNFADYNPRRMPAEKRAKLKASLAKHGFVDPAIARAEDRLLIGGHQRTDVAMRDLRMTRVPVVFVRGVSDAQAKALNIALNNKELQGDWDMTKLRELMGDLTALDGFDIGLTGFDDTQAIDILNWRPPELVPEAKQQQQPTLKSEVLVEIRATQSALEPFMRALGELADAPGVTVTIT